VASPFAILPPPPSPFRPLAPYCPISWHLTASNPSRLAPYCSPPAGTLLLITSWHPTANHRLAPYCYSSLAGIPSPRWLCSPTFLSPSCDLLYRRKPRLGYDGSWYSTPSLAHSKGRCAATFLSLPTVEPPPQPDFTVRVLGFGILAIVVVSRRFFDSFPSVTCISKKNQFALFAFQSTLHLLAAFCGTIFLKLCNQKTRFILRLI